jgi:bla regulator protein blaR1
MIPKFLFEMWPALAPVLADHLWQSTLFAIAAGLFTLLLRKNSARVRYWLWLAASLKFLIPFSLFVGIGRDLAWTPTAAMARLVPFMNRVIQPFGPSSAPESSEVLSATGHHFVPAYLAIVWLCGSVAVLSAWYMRWRKISATVRQAVPMREGREVEALCRAERAGGVGQHIEMLLSSASLEPGIFGIIRPVLIWPAGISKYLEDAHLEAVLAHEVWHVRRRDNLAAAIHMVVEAVFWFHPLVWWLGTRLVDERERACDEEVLELGSERQVYAESILKTCEFCVGFPLACVSGVTGADLKKRIVHIMTPHEARKLNFGKRLLLGLAASAAIAAPMMFGLFNATSQQAEAQAETLAAHARAAEPQKTNTARPVSSTATTSKPVMRKPKVCAKTLAARRAAAALKNNPAKRES